MGMTLNEMEEILKKYMLKGGVFDANKPYVFISYSHADEDKEKVYSLLIDLMKKGINFALDTEYGYKHGSWIKNMKPRLISENCKCMMSFYSANYVYSRPSLLEQYMRFNVLVTKKAEERKKTYENTTKKNYLPNIEISLFNSPNIIAKISIEEKKKKDKDPEKEKKGKDPEKEKLKEIGQKKQKEITEEKSKWEMVEDDEVNFNLGINGWIKIQDPELSSKEIEAWVDLSMDELQDADKVDNIRLHFLDLLKKDEGGNNSNLYTEQEEILTMLKDFGIKEDEEIKEKADLLCEEKKEDKESIDETTIMRTTKLLDEPMKEKPKLSISSESKFLRYKVSGKKYDAVVRLEKENGQDVFVVEQGSKIAFDWEANTGQGDKARITESNSVGADCIVTKDIRFYKISSMAKFVKGTSTDGAGVIVEKNLIKAEGTITDIQEMTEKTDAGGETDNADIIVETQKVERYKISGKKYDAIIRLEKENGEDVFVVEQGSRVANDWEAHTGHGDMAKIKESNSVGADCIVIKNIRFYKISSMAKFVKGTSTDGAGIIVERNRISNEVSVSKNASGKLTGLGELL